jgi:hypothetical protein
MKTNITQENLLQFIYGEVSPDMHLTIMDELTINESLKKEYDLLREGISLLNTINESPSKTSVRILMEESSQSSSLEGIV